MKEYSDFHQIREITVKTQVEVYGGKMSLFKCTFQVIFKNVVHTHKQKAPLFTNIEIILLLTQFSRRFRQK